jgi:hypothetical protein
MLGSSAAAFSCRLEEQGYRAQGMLVSHLFLDIRDIQSFAYFSGKLDGLVKSLPL